MKLFLATVPFLLPLVACQTTRSDARTAPGSDTSAAVRAQLDLPVAEPPFTELKANWKERVELRYAYVDLVGSYTETGRALSRVLDMLADRDIEPAGAPFALFYDDPGHTAVAELRSRACVPVPADAEVAAPFAVDTLPTTLVVYAYVGGPYGDVPRAYPGLYAFMKKLGWAETGPIRESYLISPGSVSDFSQLITEVQVPAQPTR
jgi:effector-binding domain-containing protein